MPKYHCIVRREKTEGVRLPWEQDLEGEVEAQTGAQAARQFAESYGTLQDCTACVCDEVVEVTPLFECGSPQTRKFMVTAETKTMWRVDHEIAP